jgi:hypothetical protein
MVYLFKNYRKPIVSRKNNRISQMPSMKGINTIKREKLLAKQKQIEKMLIKIKINYNLAQLSPIKEQKNGFLNPTILNE